MRPLIILSSGSLACGCLLVEAILRNHKVQHLPVVPEPLPDPSTWVSIKPAKPIFSEAMWVKESAADCARPNQPWYAKFQDRRPPWRRR
jgi:hypothetical protein